MGGADDLAATRAAMTAWACGDREDGAGAVPPAAVPAAAPAPPRALRMARACGFGGGACAELAGFCAAKAATSAAVWGFCAGAVAAFCRVANMAAACGFGAMGGGGAAVTSAGMLCTVCQACPGNPPGPNAVGASAGDMRFKLVAHSEPGSLASLVLSALALQCSRPSGFPATVSPGASPLRGCLLASTKKRI